MKTVLTFVLLCCLAHSYDPRGTVPPVSDDATDVKKALAELTELQLKYDANAVDRRLDAAFIYVSK